MAEKLIPEVFVNHDAINAFVQRKEYDPVPMNRVENCGAVPRVRNDADYHHVDKVWGSELWIINTPLYCGKMLSVGKGHHTSMHFHGDKHETMFCVEGQFRIDFLDSNGDLIERILNQSESIVIPPLLPHSIHGVMDTNIMFEFSTQHFDHDSYRVGKPA
jgi:oxalate decarboxylase/phosphoglucose isomerase-like protein (cupin superfamily)